MKKIIRTSTVPTSLNTFCEGLFKELSLEYEIVAVSSPGKDLDIIAKRENVRTIAVCMQRHISVLKDFVSLTKLIYIFYREKPVMVHSMTPKAGLLSMVAARITRVPVRVHTFTGLVFPTSTGLKQRLLMLTDSITCRCASNIIAEGLGVRNDLINYNITKKQIRVLGYGNVRGIDLKHYNRTPNVMKEAENIRRDLGIYDSSFTFIFVGRLVRDKGIDELVDAFCILNELYNDIHLILVGEEEKELDPISDSVRHKIASVKNIHAVGRKEDVRPWYAASNALVFPSHREGFPNVVIEAGAMGLPSIVTDINGSREIIKDGVNGIIIEPQNVKALHNAMKAFLENKDLTERLASRARELIATRFEQGYVRKCLKDFYREII